MSERELVKHIEAINASSDCNLVTLPDHWTDYGVFTPDELDRYLLEEDYHYMYKDCYGIRAKNLSLMTDEELTAGINQMEKNLVERIENLLD